MFWADRLAKEIIGRYQPSGAKPIVIRDEKTVSGRIHVGAMRGVLIHGTISEALAEQGISNVFMYELNDFDAFDTVPVYLDAEKFTPYLGKPLFAVPSPDAGTKSYADYFGQEFADVIKKTGYVPQFHSSISAYRSGKYNDIIKKALENVGSIRTIYEEVSGGTRAEEWLPIMMICEQCGKIATTRAVSFDGNIVHYMCDQEASGAKGCGFEGAGSPFDGKAKLPWKVEWAAKFSVFDVAVEGEGKDLSTKGGARDVANHISRQVFKREPPFDVPYEHFLIGGKKMSTSKGRGSSAREIANLMPPKIFRLALLSKEITQAFNFDPEGDTIPMLYDQYDKLAEGYQTIQDDDYARLFEFVHPGRALPPAGTFFPRFSQVAFLVQMPHLNLEREVATLKGGELTSADKQELAERATYAKKWLAEYAPEKFVFTLQETLPEAAKNLSELQKKALSELQNYLKTSEKMPSGEEIQQKLHQIKETLAIQPQDLFGALYLSFLGKSYGPKIGWFLSVLDKEFVVKRLQEAIA
jgi:lysyl-tRNA synthetase class 1